MFVAPSNILHSSSTHQNKEDPLGKQSGAKARGRSGWFPMGLAMVSPVMTAKMAQYSFIMILGEGRTALKAKRLLIEQVCL